MSRSSPPSWPRAVSARTRSAEGVRLLGLAPGDEVVERLGHAGVDRRRGVVGKELLDTVAGTGHGVALAFLVPGLERLVVEHLRPPEGRLEIRLGVRASKIVPARANLA